MLAAAGLASRRAAEAWIRAGRVTVNGRVATLGESADPAHDVVCVDGARLLAEPLEYWIVNKPRGVLTTRRDPEGRRSVLELVPGSRARLVPVGRLDRETEGLLVLTNDGPLHHALLHPSHQIEREYALRVRGGMRARALRRLAAGIQLDDGPTAPAGVDQVRIEDDTTSLHLTVVEGRKRQIRRALAALGHPVIALRRVRLGPLRLGRLARGAARPLSPRERAALLRAAGLAGRGGEPGGHAPRQRSTSAGTPGWASRARRSGDKRARGRRKPRTSKRPRE